MSSSYSDGLRALARSLGDISRREAASTYRNLQTGETDRLERETTNTSLRLGVQNSITGIAGLAMCTLVAKGVLPMGGGGQPVNKTLITTAIIVLSLDAAVGLALLSHGLYRRLHKA